MPDSASKPQTEKFSECGGFARDPAKVEDQVRFLARTFFHVRQTVWKGRCPMPRHDFSELPCFRDDE